MTKALDILFRNQKLLSALEDQRKCYDSFFEFSKATGLGKTYKVAKMKVVRVEKLIFKNLKHLK